MRKGIFGLLALASASFCLAGQSVSAANPSRRTIIVLVLDGLRPDMIRPETTPNLYRLKQEGVWGANSDSRWRSAIFIRHQAATGVFAAA